MKMMTMFPLLLLCVALTGAQPAERGMFQNCDWKLMEDQDKLYHVTCKPGEIINPAMGKIDVRTRVMPPSNPSSTLPIHTLDVDLSIDAGVGIEINPDFLNKNLSRLEILILRGDKSMSFGDSASNFTHGLTSLEVHDSSIDEIRKDALKGFDKISKVSFRGFNTTDILKNAFTDHKNLRFLDFTNCRLGEFETMAIHNLSLAFVNFQGNHIDEFSKESIVDTNESEQKRKCESLTHSNQPRESPVWNFIDNDIGKMDKEAIKIETAGELTFSENNINKRMKSKALQAHVGVDGCKGGKVIISNNTIEKLDEEAFAIVNEAKSSTEAALTFTGNVISYSRDPFLPSSFQFPVDQLTIDENVFPCKCENSGHSWFMPALKDVSDPLHTFYKKLWTTGVCFEDENNKTVTKKFSQSSAEDCHEDINIDVTPDPSTERPSTGPPSHNTTPSAGSISQLSSAFLSLCILFVCASAM